MGMIEDLINSILDDLNDLMQDEVFCWDLANAFERLVLDDLKLEPSKWRCDYLRDRIEKERRILRTFDHLNEVRRTVKDED